MKTHYHRRGAPGNNGHLHWSMLGGLFTVQMPWSDVLSPDGRLNLREVWGKLRDLEDTLADRKEGEGLPPMPTPNAKVVRVDNEAFDIELADRLVAYKRKRETNA